MALSSKPNILVLVDWFHPGFKAGGPIRSCVNFSYAMSKKYNIWVLTSDTDFGAAESYPNLIPNEWVEFDENIKAMYLSKDSKSFGVVKSTIQNLKPDFIYINIIFSVVFSIFPLLMKVLGQVKSQFVICPRGMFNQHGISKKTFKKKTFLNVMKGIGAFNKVTFHATSPLEERDIKRFLGEDKKVITVPNFPPSKMPTFAPRKKEAGKLSLIYLARIHPIKNLHFFLNLLSKFDKHIELNIYGPIEDAPYWEKCKSIISTLNSSIEYKGEINHNQVGESISKHDFLVLPTHGENFGHSILESFQQARPVIIANTTPWRDLEAKKVGWDLTIENDNEFLNALELAHSMNEETYLEWSKNSWELANAVINEPTTLEKYKTIFSNE